MSVSLVIFYSHCSDHVLVGQGLFMHQKPAYPTSNKAFFPIELMLTGFSHHSLLTLETVVHENHRTLPISKILKPPCIIPQSMSITIKRVGALQVWYQIICLCFCWTSPLLSSNAAAMSLFRWFCTHMNTGTSEIVTVARRNQMQTREN